MKSNSLIFLKRNLHKRILHKKAALLLAGLLLAGGMLDGCASKPMEYRKTDTAMGTVVSQVLYVPAGEACADGIIALIRRLETETLSRRLETSELYRLNETSGSGESVLLSQELSADLLQLWEVSDKSGGAFDVTIGPVVTLWNIDESAAETEAVVIPTEEEIAQLLQYTGYDSVQFTVFEEKGQLSLTLPEGFLIDLGAAGKGIACDRIYRYLEESGVSGAVVSVGGSLVTYGEKPDGTLWRIGITDPFNGTGLAGTLSLEGDWFISTSGDYERYVEADGVRYHHILNPHTGYPADSGLKSVTIVCKNGCLSDALSTACFVLGKEAGLALVKEFAAEAVMIDKEGEIFLTDGLKDAFTKQ